MPELRELPMALVDPPALPMRSGMDELALAGLAEDIRANGLIQPIVVKPEDGRFRVVAGHRRYMAHELNRAENIRALIDRKSVV